MKKLFHAIAIILVLAAIAGFSSSSQNELDRLKSENKKLKSEIESLGGGVDMSKIKFVSIGKFKSLLPDAQATDTIMKRKLLFEKVAGLVQKFYLKEKSTGEYCGIYMWDSEESFLNYKKTNLAAGTPAAYQVDGKARVELFDFMFPLRSFDGK